MADGRFDSLLSKPTEYWAILIGMILYIVMQNSAKETLFRRIMKTATSALLALGLSPALSVYFRGSENVALIAVMALGLICLDTASSIFAEKDFVKRAIASYIGVKNEAPK